jgi:WD40 repeat protein
MPVKSIRSASKSSKKPAPKKAVRKSEPKREKASAKALTTPAKSALIATLFNVTRLQFTANSQALLLARTSKKTLTLWDLASRSETPPLKALPTFTAVALSTDNHFIAMGTSSGIIAVQSTQTGKILWKTKASGEPVADIAFSLDATLVIATGPGWLRIHQVSTGDPATGFDPVPGAQCPHLAFSPDGQFLAHSEIRSNSVLVWHLPTRQVAQFIRLPVPIGKIQRLAFGHTVRTLYIAQSGQISTWNGETGQLVLDFPVAHATSMALIHEGLILATTRAATDDDKPKPAIDLWSAPTGRHRREIALPPLDFGPLTASPDGNLLALPAAKGPCWLWNTAKLCAT